MILQTRYSFTPIRIISGAGRGQYLSIGRYYYALEVTTRLRLEDSGGMVRVGPVHYNTVEEIRIFGEALVKISAGVN